jgi:hypothetical protein
VYRPFLKQKVGFAPCFSVALSSPVTLEVFYAKKSFKSPRTKL